MTDVQDTVPTDSLRSLLVAGRLTALGGAGVLGLAVARYFGGAQVLLLVLGMGFVIGSLLLFKRGTKAGSLAVTVGGTGVVVLFVATAIPEFDKLYWGTWHPVARIALGAVAITAALSMAMRTRHRQVLAGILIIVMVVIFGAVTVVANPDSGVDVQYAHEEAAALLLDGRNPYSDMVIADTSPSDVNQGVIVGYSYPPVSLITYSVAEWFGDSRFANVVLIGVLLALVLAQAIRSFPNGAVLVGVLATVPFLGGLIIAGWTEPLQAVLIVAAAVLHRRWFLSGVLLGAAVASKQYMILALVPFVAMNGPNRMRRPMVALGTAGLIYLPFILWNPIAIWDALFGQQLDRLAREDVASLWSIGIKIPSLAAVVVAGVVGLALASRVRSTDTLLLCQAAVLGVFFLLAPNVFLNFWFLVVAMVVSAVSLTHQASEEFSGEVRSRRVVVPGD